MTTENSCKGLTFNECELTILRMAVDKAQEKVGKRIVNSPEIKEIIHIVENFIKQKKLICYGGTAINNILPKDKQFYHRDVELPDYDFFSPNALQNAKELADIYYKRGYTDVEAKSGQHYGTYKVYVNFIPIADITFIEKEIYKSLKNDAMKIDNILYAPPNFLRMSMYLELSRPDGDTSRWEKVLKRLIILNEYFPITSSSCNYSLQRNLEDNKNTITSNEEQDIFNIVKDVFIRDGVVFFGGYAVSLYSRYMPYKVRHKLEYIPDFDVLSHDPEMTAKMVKKELYNSGRKNVDIIRHDPIGEIIPLHYEIQINKDTLAFIYKPIACHSYNTISINKQKIKIATIDTMLSFYLAFLYANKSYYNEFLERTLCMAKYLYEVQQKNRLSQKGLLKRFTISCYGHQETIEEIKQHKAEKYKELKKHDTNKEYEKWFLNYNPANKTNVKTRKTRKNRKSSA